MSEIRKCQKRIFTGQRNDIGGHLCGHQAKVQENGKWLCAMHTESAEASRKAKREARYKAESDAWNKRWKEEEERNRRAALFPEMLAELKRIYEKEGWVRTGEVIAKAEGRK